MSEGFAGNYSFLNIAGTPSVQEAQHANGSGNYWSAFKGDRTFDRFTDGERQFIAARDSFYMATVSETGWPYVQHRGGPKGFLKVIDDHTLAFADFRGNKQYITTGNLLTDNRVAIIMLDYPRQARLKILGRVEIFEGDKAVDWFDRVRVPGEKTPIERVFVIHVEAYDWNCPQHITPRYTAEEIREGLTTVENRLRALEQENEALRKELAAARPGSDV
jgi:predicted pyridoxine 5'-phosphate oxidase superfamily flavin-nucleotide-binding protein